MDDRACDGIWVIMNVMSSARKGLIGSSRVPVGHSSGGTPSA